LVSGKHWYGNGVYDPLCDHAHTNRGKIAKPSIEPNAEYLSPTSVNFMSLNTLVGSSYLGVVINMNAAMSDMTQLIR